MQQEEIIKEIENLKARNKRVEADKAWETSNTRRLSIILLTYVVMVLVFAGIGAETPFVNAIIPTLGFTLSTLSLSFFKKIWLKNIYKSK